MATSAARSPRPVAFLAALVLSLLLWRGAPKRDTPDFSDSALGPGPEVDGEGQGGPAVLVRPGVLDSEQKEEVEGSIEGMMDGQLQVVGGGSKKVLASITGKLTFPDRSAAEEALKLVLDKRRGMDENDAMRINGANSLIVAIASEIHEKGVQEWLGRWTPGSDVEAFLLLQLVMKVCDLGHMSTEWETHRRWVRRLEREFWRQGDAEKAQGLKISMNMNREKDSLMTSQEGFFTFVVFPLYTSLASALPESAELGTYTKENFRRWETAKPSEGDRKDLLADRGDVDVESLLEKLPLWRLSHTELAALAKDERPLALMGERLLSPLVPEGSLGKLRSFLEKINDNYALAHCDEDEEKDKTSPFPSSQHVPYHNRMHATTVLHTMHEFLEHTPLVSVVADKIFHGFKSTDENKVRLVKLMCLLTAVVHDYEHKGANNDFLQRTNDAWLVDCPSAKGCSVNEEHHFLAASTLLAQEEYNFLSDAVPNKEERDLVLKGMKDIILATDMAQHMGILQSANRQIVQALLDDAGEP